MLPLSYQLARPSAFQVNVDGGYQATNLHHLRLDASQLSYAHTIQPLIMMP